MYVPPTMNGTLSGIDSIDARQIGAVADRLRATTPTPRPGPRVDLVLSIRPTEDADAIEIEFEIDFVEE